MPGVVSHIISSLRHDHPSVTPKVAYSRYPPIENKTCSATIRMRTERQSR